MTLLKHISDVNLNFHSLSGLTQGAFSVSKEHSQLQEGRFLVLKRVWLKKFSRAFAPRPPHSYRHGASVI